MTPADGVPPLSSRFDEALGLASDLHRAQIRKGGDIPYVAHLLAVTATVLEHGGDEDEAIAALLHDGPEDQGGLATLEMIGSRFGARVRGIVAGCSDTFETPKPPWTERKQAFLRRLDRTGTDRSVLLVSAADKLHNLTSIVDDLIEQGPSAWDRFNGTPTQQLWYHRSIAVVFRRRLGGRLAVAVDAQVVRLEAIMESGTEK